MGLRISGGQPPSSLRHQARALQIAADGEQAVDGDVFIPPARLGIPADSLLRQRGVGSGQNTLPSPPDFPRAA